MVLEVFSISFGRFWGGRGGGGSGYGPGPPVPQQSIDPAVHRTLRGDDSRTRNSCKSNTPSNSLEGQQLLGNCPAHTSKDTWRIGSHEKLALMNSDVQAGAQAGAQAEAKAGFRLRMLKTAQLPLTPPRREPRGMARRSKSGPNPRLRRRPLMLRQWWRAGVPAGTPRSDEGGARMRMYHTCIIRVCYIVESVPYMYYCLSTCIDIRQS